MRWFRSIKFILSRWFHKPDQKPTQSRQNSIGKVDVFKRRLKKMFEMAVIREDFRPKVDYVVERILDYKDRYQLVSEKTGVPWDVVAAIHSLECGLNFNRILHNGEKLPVKKTKLVPKNRGPFKEWSQAAIDALNMKKNIFPKKWDMANKLNFLENYNGLGYRKYHKNVPTPYLWSGTNHYTKGKYVRDGKFDPNAVSKQVGAVPIILSLSERKDEKGE